PGDAGPHRDLVSGKLGRGYKQIIHGSASVERFLPKHSFPALFVVPWFYSLQPQEFSVIQTIWNGLFVNRTITKSFHPPRWDFMPAFFCCSIRFTISLMM